MMKYIIQGKKLAILFSTITLLAVIIGACSSNKMVAEYMVMFESNGGTTVETQVVTEGNQVQLPDEPTKTGFRFIEWQLDGESYDFDTVVKADLIVKAVWEREENTTVFTIEYDSNGGSSVDPVEVAEGNSFSEPVPPTREGFIFLNWHYNGEEFDFSTVTHEDLLLVAQWEEAPAESDLEQATAAVIQADNNTGNKKDNSATNGNASVTVGTSEQTSSPTDSSVDEKSSSSNNHKESSKQLTWDQMKGTWYLTGTDDVTIKIYKDGNGNLCYQSTHYTLRPIGVNYQGGEGSCSSPYDSPDSFAKDNQFTIDGNKLLSYSSNKSFTFYKTKNYPQRVVSDLERFYNNLQGKWYLYGYTDVYFTFTAGTRQGEKVLFYDEHNFCLSTAESYPSSCGGSSYYDYYGLNHWMKDAGITYANGEIKVSKNGKTLRFVSQPVFIPISVTGISLNKSNVTLYEQQTEQLTATVKPANATDASVSWSSSNSKVAKVDSKGIVTALAVGTATITAKTKDGAFTAKATITVSARSVTGVTLNNSSMELHYGKTSTLTASIQPANATDQAVTWTSSNPNVVKVDSKGVVTAVGIGSATITVTTKDGGHTAKCTITVSYPKLTADVSIGLSSRVSSTSGASQGIFVSVKPNGGTGNYTYYNIKLYYNGELVGEGSNQELFVPMTNNGTYSTEVIVRDSSGTEVKVTKAMTKS